MDCTALDFGRGDLERDGRLANSSTSRTLHIGSTSTAGLALISYSAGVLDVSGLEWRL